MADSVEIIRMMRHAASRLEQEDAQAILPDNYRKYSDARECLDAAVSADMAMTYGAAVLRLVASFLSDGESAEPASPPLRQQLEGESR